MSGGGRAGLFWSLARRIAKPGAGGGGVLKDAFRSDEITVRGAGPRPPAGKASVRTLRRWSRANPWIRAAINLRRSQVSRGRFDLVPLEGDLPVNEAARLAALGLLRKPNPKGESFRSLIEPVVEDILVLDQGCIEIEATVGGRIGTRAVRPIAYLWGVDGGTIRFDESWDGTDPSKPRYYQYDESGQLLQKFRNDELLVIVEHSFTYTPLGLSALETLAETIEADLASAEYNARAVKQATPPGILDLGEGIRPDQVDAFRAYWDAEIAGKSQIAITGGGKNTKWTPLTASNRDMQFMEWQLYLARKICAVFAVMPQDIGITFDVNRSTSEVGQEFTEDRGIGPLMDLIAEYLTREVVSRFDPNLRFAWTDMGKQDQASAAAYYEKAMPGIGWVRPNDALAERGSDVLPDGQYGDEVWVDTPSGPVPISVYIERLGVETEKLRNPPPPPAPPAGGPPPPGGAPPEGAPPEGAPPEGGGAKAQAPFRWPRLTDWYS